MATSTSSSPSERQREIYLKGVSGTRPRIPLHPEALETAAKDHMSPKAFAYIAGGAGLEHTMRNNRSGFDKWRIQPQMLKDVSQRDIQIELFGRKLPGPLFLSPVGVLDLARKKGDLRVGAAAAATGIPMIFSNQASEPMEKVAQQMGDSPRWFQLYWSKSNELVESLVQRAEACGCEAIVVTLDTTLLGWRIRDLDMASLPFLRGKGIAQYVSDPVFQQLIDAPQETQPAGPKPRLTLDTLGMLIALNRTYPGNFFNNLRSGRPLQAVRTFLNIFSRTTLNWDDLSFLRERTQLPILLKGILHPEDAKKALDHGVDGLLVSNHGGRQVDGAIGAIEALPAIVSAVEGKVPIILDSGIRGGADMFKALALGATAVGIGRPYAYALAVAGQAGVEELIRNYLADFELTMGLAGCRSIAEIGRANLTK